MRGWLVEHQHRRGCEQRAGQHDPLPLAAGKLAALLPDEGVEPIWKPGYPVPDPSAPQRLLDLAHRWRPGKLGGRCRGCSR